jgi:hypothetical protein
MTPLPLITTQEKASLRSKLVNEKSRIYYVFKTVLKLASFEHFTNKLLTIAKKKQIKTKTKLVPINTVS